MAKSGAAEKKLSVWRPIQAPQVALLEDQNIFAAPSPLSIRDKKLRRLTSRIRGSRVDLQGFVLPTKVGEAHHNQVEQFITKPHRRSLRFFLTVFLVVDLFLVFICLDRLGITQESVEEKFSMMQGSVRSYFSSFSLQRTIAIPKGGLLRVTGLDRD